MFVITADQRRSRRHGDLVPQALDLLNAPLLRPGRVRRFERTAGDEIQGVVDSPPTVVDVVVQLVRTDAWRLGVGIGEADTPMPRSTRAASGPVFVSARLAVTAARSSPQHLAVRGRTYAGSDPVRLAESALWLLSSVLRRRTPEGWEVVDLLQTGMSQREAATALAISESAVSQRVERAGWAEEQRGRELAVHHLLGADT